MKIHKGLNTYRKLFGMRASLLLLGRRIAGASEPSEISGCHKSIIHPIIVRSHSSDVVVYEDVLLKRQYDVSLTFPPEIIVDAGANVGITSVYYANKYPQAKIYAIEPEPSNFELLVRNTAKYSAIVPIQAALWSGDGHVSLDERDHNGRPGGAWSFFVSESKGKSVRAITVQTLMIENGLSVIDILKMDIEGAEKEVFEKCDWLSTVRVLAIELHDRFKPGCSDVVTSATQEFTKTQHGEVAFYVRP
jgi:FkbM family methyltransferase